MIMPQPLSGGQDNFDYSPANLQEESAVLGATLLDPKVANQLKLFRPGDFALTAHQLIFAALLHLVDHDRPVDYLELGQELERRGQLIVCGGYEYIVGLGELVVLTRPITHRQHVLREYALRRRLLAVGHELIERAADPAVPVADLICDLQAKLTEAAAAQ